MFNPKLLNPNSLSEHRRMIGFEDGEQPLSPATGSRLLGGKGPKQYLETQLKPFLNDISDHEIHSKNGKNPNSVSNLQLTFPHPSNEKSPLYLTRNNPSPSKHTDTKTAQQHINNCRVNKCTNNQHSQRKNAGCFQLTAKQKQIRKQIEKRYSNSDLRQYRYGGLIEQRLESGLIGTPHRNSKRVHSLNKKQREANQSQNQDKSVSSQDMQEYQYLCNMKIVNLQRYHEDGKGPGRGAMNSRSSSRKEEIRSINRRLRTQPIAALTPTHNSSSKEIHGRDFLKPFIKHVDNISNITKIFFTAGIGEQVDPNGRKPINSHAYDFSIRNADRSIKSRSNIHRTVATPKRHNNLSQSPRSPQMRMPKLRQNGQKATISQKYQF